jgi:calcium-dependent protein kinase
LCKRTRAGSRTSTESENSLAQVSSSTQILGAFGDVRICLHKESNTQRAVKILYKANMSEDDEKMLINEISILSGLDHPNIVKMYEFFQDEKRYYIITE